MKFHRPRSMSLASLLVGCACSTASAGAEDWPGWRGPRGDGTSLEKDAPIRWDAANLVWKVKVPGIGHASPIVWGDRIFTATAAPADLERALVCFARADGKILWRKTVVRGPLEKLNPENSHASGTPATDGKRVFAAFRIGEEIAVAGHDAADGRQLWLVRPGTHTGEWGFSNEPVLFREKVILDCDSKDKSFLIALSQEDGRTIWRVDRSRRGISYSAPLIREMAGRVQLIQCGDRCVAGFDPDTGAQLWTVDGPSQEFVATPTYSEKDGLVFISSSWPDRHLLAIRPDGRGDVTKTHVAWRDTKGAPYVPSPLVAGEYLLTVNNGGVAFCYEAGTGKVLWQERLGRHHASPVLLDGLVFFTNDDGAVNVIRPGPTFDRIAKYELGELCYASPAISRGQVFLRGFEHLYCFGKSNSAGGASGGDRRVDSVPFVSGKEGYACYRTPALAVGAKGTMLAFCGGRVNDHRDEGDIDNLLKRSTDGGKTWGPPQVPADRARLCKQDYSWMANVVNIGALAWPEEAKVRAIYKMANTAAPQARFLEFPPVRSREIRLHALKAGRPININEFQVFPSLR